MNLESLILNVCEVRNEYEKELRDVSEKYISKTSKDLSEEYDKLSPLEQMELMKKLCMLHGGIHALDFVIELYEDHKQGDVKNA